MPKRKTKPQLQIKSGQEPKAADLEEFIREASEVKQLTQHPGWAIIERDLTEYQSGLISKIAYLDPTKPESREARILFIAVDKLFAIVNDYKENRDKAIELLQKIQNPDSAIMLDIDNEI